MTSDNCLERLIKKLKENFVKADITFSEINISDILYKRNLNIEENVFTLTPVNNKPVMFKISESTSVLYFIY
jgi:hypothetical protein